MHMRTVVVGALVALAVSSGLRNVDSCEQYAQWGGPTKRNATPRPQVTPASGTREQRNDAQRPIQPFGALKK